MDIIAYDWLDTEFNNTLGGHVLVAATPRGVCRVSIGNDKAWMLGELRAKLGTRELQHGSQITLAACNAIESYLRGHSKVLDVAIDLPEGTDLQMRVWQALQLIPYGQTITYRELAERVDVPTAVRAVASACGANPLALIIPCHRVVGKGGTLNGYRWGIEYKRALLELEGVPSAPSAFHIPLTATRIATGAHMAA